MASLLLAAFFQIGFAQDGTAIIVQSQIATGPRLPQYLIYRYFLGWVSALDKQASAAGFEGTYKFAEPFGDHVGLTIADLDVLRTEATALSADLKIQDLKAAAIVAAFRAKAKEAARRSQPLPEVPPEIPRLQAERTALLVQHFVTVKTRLGPVTSSRLDQYLGREFLPHISLRPIGIPSAEATGLLPSLSIDPSQ